MSNLDFYKKAIEETFSVKKLKYLESGLESVLYTDYRFTYKYLYNFDLNEIRLLESLVNRFKESKHFINFHEIKRHNGDLILKLEYLKGNIYDKGYHDQLKEYLIESYMLGIVCWDIKPSNFVLHNNKIVFIDYGRDIKPFDVKDFMYMIQRVFLMIKRDDTWRDQVRQSRKDWSGINMKKFRSFFNEIWHKLLTNNGKLIQPKYSPIRRFTKQNINNLLFQESSPIWISEPNLSNIESKLNNKMSTISFNDQITLLMFNLFQDLSKQKWRKFRQLVFKLGFQIISTKFSPVEQYDCDNKKSRFQLIKLKYSPKKVIDVSLMIKVCYQDHKILESQINHIVQQLIGPRLFEEIYVVVDPRSGSFLRQFDQPEKQKTLNILEKLVDKQIIDRYIIASTDKEEISQMYLKWFNVVTHKTHSVRNIPVYPQLFGFENCNSKYLLQLDCDVFIGRYDINHDYLKDMVSEFEKDNKILSVGFNICHDKNSDFIPYYSRDGISFAPEVRFCLFDVLRLKSQQPYPNYIKNGHLELSWYRSVQQFQNNSKYNSLRGGDPRSFYIHPPNIYKSDLDTFFQIRDRVEKCKIPAMQYENYDLIGNIDDWSLPIRNEEFIFLINGRNVSINQFDACWSSLTNQTRNNWGAIIVDDASTTNIIDYINLRIGNKRKNVTLIHNSKRRGSLANIVRSINHFCRNPYSIIIILDMDDRLINDYILENLLTLYNGGVQLTIGNYLRRDKGLQPYVPNFENPREDKKGGDAWLHLRTFRKYLFDQIDPHDFKIDGRWIEEFTELTYMISMIEMSTQSHFIPYPIYYWSPRKLRNRKHSQLKQKTLEHVNQITPYQTLPTKTRSSLLPVGEIVRHYPVGKIIVIRYAEKEQQDQINGYYPREKDLDITEFGIKQSKLFGQKMPKIDQYLVSNLTRTQTTAKAIASTNDTQTDIIKYDIIGGFKIIDQEKWKQMKAIFGYIRTIKLWLKDLIHQDIIQKYSNFISELLEIFAKAREKNNNKTIIVITHDHVITALIYHIYNELRFDISFLSGIILDM